MSSQRTVKSIVSAIQKLYPRELADGSWDNTGLLLGAPLSDHEVSSADARRASVLLAIDLTASVATEAIESNRSMVVAYHPIIFRGLKSLTSSDTQQASLLRLARAGISVYCPHTACDAALGGVNDWLMDGLTGGESHELWRKIAQQSDQPIVPGHEGAGMGRIARLKSPVSLDQLIARTKSLTGLSHVQAAISPYVSKRDSDSSDSCLSSSQINTIAVCAGSGGSVLRGADADVYVTGELGHHEALALVENGIHAITCGHSNTERGFLATFRDQLHSQLVQSGDFDSVQVSLSDSDKDPFQTV